MLLVQHREWLDPQREEWQNCSREDLGTDTSHQNALALFYTPGEAAAYITAICGLMHCGGSPRDFRTVDVEHDGEAFTILESAVRS